MDSVRRSEAGPALLLVLGSTPASVSEARGRLRDLLTAAGVEGPLVNDVLTASTEAVANAALHAYRPPDPGSAVELEAEVGAAEVRVVVRDFGGGFGTDSANVGAGLGLTIMASLADRVELRRDRRASTTELVLGFDRAR
jgi:anti-sigma regulatory factor (Ser/Thr protein kinase)